jgi:hypothetical protein
MSQPTTIRQATSTAPKHLDAQEAELYSQIVRAYGLRDEVSLRILEEGMASLQRARRAREAIDKDGMTMRDVKNQLKPHPLCAVERDARAAGLAAFRQLNLELPRSLDKRRAW